MTALPSPPPAPDVPRRAKRRRYTAVACDECRRRKIKCLPGGSNGRCQRCAKRGRDQCGFLEAVVAPAHDGDSDNGHGESTRATVAALRNDVNVLRSTLSGLMAASTTTSTTSSSAPAAALSPVSAPAAPTVAPGIDYGAALRLRPSAATPLSTTPIDSAVAGPALKEARFVGPTRPAYSFQAGGQALSRLGIASLDTAQASGVQTPVDTSAVGSPVAQPEPEPEEPFWAVCTRAEFEHWIGVFEEEIEPVYPCVTSHDFVRNADEILPLARAASVGVVPQSVSDTSSSSGSSTVTIKDAHLATLAVAMAMVLEAQGQADPSAARRGLSSGAIRALVSPVERHVLNILEPSRELADLQLLILLSIFYFVTDQDLPAWRTIGLAAREALVMGLHRRSALCEAFGDGPARALAVRVFWTIYVLDRRWSFGAGLSFALVDRDIDPDLPEPSAFPDPHHAGQHQSAAYLQCMVGYGRLSSTLWDALHPGAASSKTTGTGSSSRDWASSTTLSLDLRAQEWLESIPSSLRLRHPRLGLAALAQPPILQRLRALLYLRGNHIRILIYRYYLLSPSRIHLSYPNAHLAVDIARDSIAVLVHLDDSSQIYRRQQAAFNYFLVSALAVLFLAVCNEPETFAGTCKKEIVAAVGLLRGFSKSSYGSRRLWRSVRGVVPLLRKLEARRAGAGEGSGDLSLEDQQQQPREGEEQQNQTSLESGQAQITIRDCSDNTAGIPGSGTGLSSMINDQQLPQQQHQQQQQQQQQQSLDYDQSASSMTDTSPDFGVMGNELMDLFEMFESGQPFYNPAHQDRGQAQQYSHLDAMSWLGDGIGDVPEYISAEQGAISSQFNMLI